MSVPLIHVLVSGKNKENRNKKIMDRRKRRKLKQPSVLEAFDRKKNTDGGKLSDGEKDESGKKYYENWLWYKIGYGCNRCCIF